MHCFPHKCKTRQSMNPLVPVITVVHNDIDASIQEEVKDFLVISVILRIWIIKERMQPQQNYYLVANWTGNYFSL